MCNDYIYVGKIKYLKKHSFVFILRFCLKLPKLIKEIKSKTDLNFRGVNSYMIEKKCRFDDLVSI